VVAVWPRAWLLSALVAVVFVAPQVGELEVVGCASDFCGGSVVAALSVSIVHFAGVAVPASARAVHYLAASSYCCEKK